MDFERAPRANLRWAPHLECWRGRSYAGRLVRRAGMLWFVKSGWEKHPGARERDRLGYLLGRGIVNVAEVRALQPDEVDALRAIGIELRPDLPPDRIWLSRFVGDSVPETFPNRTLDAAIAGELVYSLWIRRRDAHAFNRAFVGGLPIFFDHETAFLGEPHLSALSSFFEVAHSPGYAGLWRLDVGTVHELDTCVLRARERARFAMPAPQPVLLPAESRAGLLSAIDEVCDAIRSIPRRQIGARIGEAGFRRREARGVLRFLLHNRAKLSKHVSVLKRLVEAPLCESKSRTTVLQR